MHQGRCFDLAGHGGELCSEAPEGACLQSHPPQEVGSMGVVACRYQDQARTELAQNGDEDPGERRRVYVLRRARGQGNVHRKALALPPSHLASGAGPRVEGALMHREVKHSCVRVEDVLGAVAVVDVPIQDSYPLYSARTGVLGGYGNVVYEAEAHPVVSPGVVTWGAGYREGGRPGESAIYRPDGGPARKRCGLPRVFVQARIQVKVTSTLPGDLLDAAQIGGVVNRGEGLLRGRLAGAPLY